MGKRLILILALAFVVGVSLNAYAEVQNVKVSGDVTVYGIARNNLDLAKTPVSGNGFVNSGTYDDKEAYLAEIAKLRVDADLTDNVSVTTRYISQRNMNGTGTYTGLTNTNIGFNGAVAAEAAVAVHLAYVTLKEFLYSPLTLMVGRQALRFGNGWVVGDPDTNGFSSGNLSAGDLSQFKAFDAVRATLDYSPLTVDVIYAKIAEARVNLNDDITLTGVNAKYALDKQTTIEGFLFSKTRGNDSTAAFNVDAQNMTSFIDSTGNAQKTDKVHTIGARVVNNMTVNNLIVDAQAAYQFGTYNPKFDPNAKWNGALVGGVGAQSAKTAPRSAWGAELIATYLLKDVAAISKYNPSITGIFLYLSGEKRDRLENKTMHGWDPMFEDQTMGHLINAMFGFSNIKLGALSAQAKPTEDTTAKVDWVAGWFNKRFSEGDTVNLSGVSTARTFTMGTDSYVGQEVDLTLTYDYTEDVQFSLLGGIFVPGKSINQTRNANQSPRPHRASATELIGSMKVTF